MELSEIQRKQWEFIQKMSWDKFSATQVFSHLIEELGEVIKHFLYKEGYKIKGAGHKGVETDVGAELAQVFGLFLQLVSLADVDLEEEWMKEFKRNQKRFDVEQWKQLTERR